MKTLGDWLVPIIVLLAWSGFLWKGYNWHRTASPSPPAKAVPGCLVNSGKSAMAHGVALRDLPVNWFVTPSDITGLPSAVGRYIACNLKTGDNVIPQDVQSMPALDPSAGDLTYTLPLPAGSPSETGVNAGFHIQVLRNPGPAIIEDARVLAISCAAICSAIFEVTPAQWQLLDNDKTGTLDVMPRK